MYLAKLRMNFFVFIISLKRLARTHDTSGENIDNTENTVLLVLTHRLVFRYLYCAISEETAKVGYISQNLPARGPNKVTIFVDS